MTKRIGYMFIFLCLFNLLVGCFWDKQVDVQVSINKDDYIGKGNITNIEIPDTITYIGTSAFESCTKLQDVYYKGTIEDWCNIKMKSLFSNPMCYAEHFYMLDKNEQYYEVTEIEIPNTIKYIGEYQFAGFSNLKNITISKEIKIIGSYAFINCSNLTNVYYNGTIEDWCNITFEDSYSNPMCNAEHIYMLDENNEYYEVTKIEIPNTVTSIGDNQFYGFNKLKAVIFEENSKLTSIGSFAFCECNNLINVYYNGTIEDWCNIIFEDDDSNPMYYAEHFYMLDKNNEYHEVTEIEIPDTVTSIGYIQFYGFKNLKEVIFSENSQLSNIGASAFYNCDNLNKVIFGENSQLLNIGASAFYDCTSLTSIEIPNSVINIGESAFYSCDNLNKVIFEENSQLTSIGESAFKYTSLETIKIPDSVISIEESAFYNCDNLKEVIFEKNSQLESLEESAFYDCDNLLKVTFEENSQLISIEEFAFYDCDSLKEVIFKGNSRLTNIGASVLYNCKNLTNITIPESVKSIGAFAFSGCANLTNVYYDGTIEGWCNIEFGSDTSNPMYYIGNFYMKAENDEYYGITKIEVPSTVISIGDCQFLGFNKITKITISNSVTSIENSAFAGCTSLREVVFEKGSQLMNIYNNAFYGCKNLKTIKIPSGVTLIGNSAFASCTSLSEVIFEENSQLEMIGYEAFYDCSFAYIVIPKNVKYIFETSIYNSHLKTVYCEISTPPVGWNDFWSNKNYTVIWGYEKDS